MTVTCMPLAQILREAIAVRVILAGPVMAENVVRSVSVKVVHVTSMLTV